MRFFVIILGLWLIGLGAQAQEPPSADAPRRIVSMNLCTDQLALLISAPERLVSISNWAFRPGSSALHLEAEKRRDQLVVNRGSAEQIFLLKPDLVLAGAYSNRATLNMLRRLGVRIEEFAPAQSFADIRARLRQMGEALGREAEAEAQVAAFNTALRIQAARLSNAPLTEAAYFEANNYTMGAGSLAHEVLVAAGFENLAEKLGVKGVAKLPLEVLALRRPLIVQPLTRQEGLYGRAYENLRHPALANGAQIAYSESKWSICGGPFTARSIETLIDARAH